MDTSSLKAQAKALAVSLREQGVVVTPSQALNAVSRLESRHDWHVARASAKLGAWNATQQVVYAAYPPMGLLPLEPGEPYQDCADDLFIALMDVADKQPLSRVIKTVAYWADAASKLLAQAVTHIDRGVALTKGALPVPHSLDAPFRKFLQTELHDDFESWSQLAQRLSTVLDDLYAVEVAMRRLQSGTNHDVLVLEARQSNTPWLAVGVPEGTSVREACLDVEHTARDLARGRASKHWRFDYSYQALSARLARKGYLVLGPAFRAPYAWDELTAVKLSPLRRG